MRLSGLHCDVVVGWLSFLLAWVFVGVTAAAVVARLQPPHILDRVVWLGVIAVAQIELSLLVAAAAFESLDRATVLAINAVVAAAALAYGGKSLLRAAREFHRPQLSRARALPPWSAVLVVAGAAEAAWRVFSAAVLPPYAYDGLSYHLVATAHWLQQGSLATSPLNVCCAHYPLNTELVFAWPAVLIGDDTLVDAVQIGFAIVGAAAVAGIARIAGVSPGGAAAAGAIFFLTPVILAQSATNYNDIAFTAMFLCAVFLVLRYTTGGRKKSTGLVLAAVAAGFALGAKGTGLEYTAVLLLVVAVALVLRLRGGLQARTVAVTAVAFLAALLAVGGFWYGRNLVQHGNPVYPFEVKIAGVQIFSGRQVSDILTNPSAYRGESNWVRVAHSWAHDASPTRGGAAYYQYEERVGGFGPVWPWLSLPAIVAFAYYAVRRRRELVWALIAPIVLIFLLQPYQWWSRFTMILPALGAVALVQVVERLRGRFRVALSAGVVVAVLFGAAAATAKVDPAGHGRRISAFRVVRLAAAPGRERTVGNLFHPEYRWLDRVPEDAHVAVEVAEEPRFLYPVFGARFTRHVVPLRAADAGGLTRQLGRDRADYAFVARGGLLDRLMSGLPGARRIYRDERVTAWHLNS